LVFPQPSSPSTHHSLAAISRYAPPLRSCPLPVPLPGAHNFR
jgi:hypothetical protein